jgi:hypothetical protein
MNERFLSMLSKITSGQWKQFLGALDGAGQQHVADMLRAKQTTDLPGFTVIFISLVHKCRLHAVSSTTDLQNKTAQGHAHC